MTADNVTQMDLLRSQLFATVGEIAPILRSDERTVRRAIEQGQIPGIRVGNSIRIPVAEFLRVCRVDPENSDSAPASALPAYNPTATIETGASPHDPS